MFRVSITWNYIGFYGYGEVAQIFKSIYDCRNINIRSYETAENAYQTVLNTAGCFPRDHVSNRLIKDTREGTSWEKA